MFNTTFLKRKIKLIQEDLSNLELFRNYTFDQIASQPATYAAVERILERMITRAIDINRHCIAELGKGNEHVRTYEDTFF